MPAHCHHPESSPFWPLTTILGEIAARVLREQRQRPAPAALDGSRLPAVAGDRSRTRTAPRPSTSTPRADASGDVEWR